MIPAAHQSRYVITFNTDNTFDVTADCNQVAGSSKNGGSSGLAITPGSFVAVFGTIATSPLFLVGTSIARVW